MRIEKEAAKQHNDIVQIFAKLARDINRNMGWEEPVQEEHSDVQEHGTHFSENGRA